jgi:hypothetical protein
MRTIERFAESKPVMQIMRLSQVMRRHIVTFAAPLTILIVGAGLPGCASRPRVQDQYQAPLGMRGVPESAELLRDSRDSMSIRAPSPGRVYLYDVDDDALAWSGTIEKGQRFNVDPGGDRISIEDQVAYHRSLCGGHRLRIFFDPVK